MTKEQHFITIESENLIEQVQTYKDSGYRFVQACCTKVSEGFEITYSFDKDHDLYNVQILVPEEQEVMSITKIYWGGFIYENEMKDLFGVKFAHMELDYGGHFFRVAKETPWNPKD